MIIKYDHDNDQITIVAAETEERQVALYFFDNATGTLISNNFIGTLNPFTFSDIIAFDDGGIAIVGTTFLAKRFERVYLQKLSRNQLTAIF
jgi:hypothetical protein